MLKKCKKKKKKKGKKKKKRKKKLVDHESEFYKNSFEKWLKDSDIKMHSAYNDGKSIVAERFIRTLTHKI